LVLNRYADKYGFVDREKALKTLKAEEKTKKDQEELVSWKRKNPEVPEDMFLRDTSDSVYNPLVINTRRAELYAMNSKPYRRGYFDWIDQVDGPTEWVDDPNGPMKCGLFLDKDGAYQEHSKKLRNNVYQDWEIGGDGQRRKIFYPLNNNLFRFGADPQRYKRVDNERRSAFAGHGFHLFDPNLDGNKSDHNKWISYNFMLQFHMRPQEFEEAGEHLIKAMWYYGAGIFPETSVTSLSQYLVSRGYGPFLFLAQDIPEEDLRIGKQEDYGASSTEEVIDTYVRWCKKFINRHGSRVKFEETLEDMADFDPKDTKKFDLAVSAGYTGLATMVVPTDFHMQVDQVDSWVDEFEYQEGGARAVFDRLDDVDDKGKTKHVEKSVWDILDGV
jgi:hypothetical protein